MVTFGEEGVVMESGHQGAPMLTLELGVLRQEGGGHFVTILQLVHL